MRPPWMVRTILCLAAALGLTLFPGASPGTPAPTRSTIRIATWNLEWLGRSRHEGRDPRSDADFARLARYARRLEADIVALQEVDGEAAARRVFDPAIYAFHFTGDDENPQRAGFAYRKSLRVTPFPDLKELAVGGTRRGADIALRAGGREMRLLSIHLKAGCWGEPLATPTDSCGILRRQLPVLEAWIDARARDEVPFAILGDFNRRFEPGDDFWAGIEGPHRPEAKLSDATAGRESACWGGEFPLFIDHIVLSRHAAGWLVPGSFRQLLYDSADAAFKPVLSDHCPILVALSPGAAAPGPPPAGRVPVRLRPGEAALHAGEVATVCGVVASAHFASASPRQPTFLDLERPHPDAPLTVVIWGDDRRAFGTPEVSLKGHHVCVTGRIRIYKGRPEIIAAHPAQILPAEEKPGGRGP